MRIVVLLRNTANPVIIIGEIHFYQLKFYLNYVENGV